jgi:hypothetical protein
MLPQEKFAGRNPALNALGDSWNTGPATFNHWGVSGSDNFSHMPQASFIPWILTGDYRYEEVLVSTAHYAQAATSYSAHDPVAAGDTYYWGSLAYRLNDWGSSYTGNGGRMAIWQVRDIGLGAYAAKDGTPEKEKLTHALDLQMYLKAGWWNITEAVVYKTPCSGTCGDMDSPWLFGRRRLGNSHDNGHLSPFTRNAPACGYPEEGDSTCQSIYCRYQESPWEDKGYGGMMLGQLDNLGFASVAPIRLNFGKSVANLLVHPLQTRPWVAANYRSPLMPVNPESTPTGSGCPGQSYTFGDSSSDAFTSMANYVGSYSAVTLGLSGWDPAHAGNPIGGFNRLVYAGAALSLDGVDIAVSGSPTGRVTGRRAFDFFRATLFGRDIWGDNPHLTYTPNWYHRVEGISVVSGGGSATITFKRPENEIGCKYAIGTSWPASSSDASDTAVSSLGVIGSFTVAATTGVEYLGRVSCGLARSEFRFVAR